MISIAGQKKPHGDFRVADIFKNTIFIHRKFDVVYSSGIFNIDLGNNDDFLNLAISKFDELSEKFCIFNLLHKRSGDKEAGYYYCDPDKIHSLIVNHEISHKRIKIIDDYLTNDFTVIIFK